MGEADKLPCDLATEYPHSCNHTATFKVRWGKSDSQAANVCNSCVSHLFQHVNPQIAAGVCFWIQEKLY